MWTRFLPRWAKSGARLLVSSDARWDWTSEWGRRLRAEPLLPDAEIRTVMVICYGNICRSAFAGPMLSQLRPDLEVRSAGFAASPGKPAEPGAIRGAERFGVALETHGAHRLEADDVAWADLILGMEGHHTRQMARYGANGLAKSRVLGHFLEAAPYAISDPWGCDDSVFDETFDRIGAALQRVAALLPPAVGDDA